MKKRTKLMAGLAAAVLAVSAMCFGFAQWSSDINLNGSVSASGKWDVAITDAALETSSAGAVVTPLKVSGGSALVSTGNKVSYTASTIITSTDDAELSGTQSTKAMSKYTYYYAIDTAKYAVDQITSLTADARTAIVSDESTVTVSDVLNLYYMKMDYSDTAGSYAKVVNAMISDMDTLLKEKFPDTYQNYALVYLSSSGNGKWNYVIAENQAVEVDSNVAVSAASAQYADVAFTLPGAWANYSVTITNNGTANANLSDYSLDFTALDSSIFTVDQPTGFDGEVLEPGESCTFNFVVKADTDAAEMNAESAAFVVTLHYAQDTVEDAPSAGHTGSPE